MTPDAEILTRLDYPTPVIACERPDAHDAWIPPAQWRVKTTCGCVRLLCGPHAEQARQRHNAALAGQYSFCGMCGKHAHLQEFEKITTEGENA